MINHITGDIIKLAEGGKFDYILQGCNCFHTMGSGLAGQLVKKYPLVLEADKTTAYGDREKLGKWTSAKISANDSQFTIVNVYTQFFFGLGTDVFEYDSFDEFLKSFGEYLKTRIIRDRKIQVAFPKIGAGLAGGNWTKILQSISNFSVTTSEFVDVTIVNYVND
jgi:O-acetyl-ADP-ribose deacetylase (regulator of RNase III)